MENEATQQSEQPAPSRAAYGGQAVVEGVMIRGTEHAATAVRLPDGQVTVQCERVDSIAKKGSWLRLAFLRGTPALVDSLRLGYRTLIWSADQAMADEAPPEPKGVMKYIPMSVQYVLTIAIAMTFAIGLFVLTPTWLISHLFPIAPGGSFAEQFIPTWPALARSFAEGLLRLIMLVLYIVLIARSKNIRRVFAYHGAEHKVVNAWEAGAPLTVEGAKPYSRIHPRCGTSFLFLFFVVGILVHALIGWPPKWVVIPSRIVMLPIVAGIAYELIRLAGKMRNSLLLKVLVWPGMALQRLTTAEPTDDQIEVAITAMRGVLETEGVIAPETAPACPVQTEALGAAEA